MSGETYSSGAHETWCGSFGVGAERHGTLTERMSVSIASGARSGNRTSDAPHAAIAKPGNAMARNDGETADSLMPSPFQPPPTSRQGTASGRPTPTVQPHHHPHRLDPT